MIAPLSSILSAAFDFGIMLALIWRAMLVLGVYSGTPLASGFCVHRTDGAAGLGHGLVLTGLDAVMRDVRIILNLVLQVWYFASPIIYPVQIVPPEADHLLLSQSARAVNAGLPLGDAGRLGPAAALAIGFFFFFFLLVQSTYCSR